MTRKLSAPQIGFFGLNGAKILLGATLFFILFFIIRKIPGFTLFNDISYSFIKDIPTPILTLILALFFACASLVGIIIGEIVDYIIVLYWRGVNQTRLNDFEDTIMKYINPEDESHHEYETKLRIYVNHVFLGGDVWEGYYLLPYRQEILTRLFLILTFFSVGFFVLLISLDFSLLNLTADYIDRLTHTNFFILLILILTALGVLFFSLRIKIEPNWSEAILKLLKKDLIPLIFMMLLYLGIWLLKDAAAKNVDSKLLDSWFALIIWLLSIIVFLILMSLLHLGAMSQIHKAKKQESVDNKELFGAIVDNDEQWYNLIICYYELFFYRVKERKEDGKELSKPESYLRTISGAYVYNVIKSFSSDVNERKNEGSDSIDHDSNLKMYLHSLDKTIDSVYGEFERGNFERAKQIYSALDEKILIYFANLPRDKEEANTEDGNDSTAAKNTPNLRYEAIPLYLIKNSRAIQLIEEIINGNTLDRILRRLKTLKGEDPEFKSQSILKAIISNQYTTENSLKAIIDDIEYTNELDSDGLFSIVKHLNVSNNVVQSLLTKDRDPEIIDPDILRAIAEKEELSSQILILLLEPRYKKINSGVLLDIANHPNVTSDILDGVLTQILDNKIIPPIVDYIDTPSDALGGILNPSIDKEVLKSIAGHLNATPDILNRILIQNIDREILWDIANNKNATSDIFNNILARSVNNEILQSIAGHSNATSDVFRKILTQNAEKDILGAIAKNQNVSLKILREILTKKPYFKAIDSDILEAIADNKMADVNIFETILWWYDHYVTQSVLRAIVGNSRSNKEVLKQILTTPIHRSKVTFLVVDAIEKHPETDSILQEEVNKFRNSKR